MTNEDAHKKADAAIRRVLSAVDKDGDALSDTLPGDELFACYEQAIAYVFKQGPRPEWWDRKQP